MRLVTFEKGQKQGLGIWLDSLVMDVQAAGLFLLGQTPEGLEFASCCKSMLSLLQAADETWITLQKIARQIDQIRVTKQETLVAQGVLFPQGTVQVLAPLPNPGKVICVAGNFPTSGSAQKPDFPIIFLKPSSTITGPGKPIWVSEMTQNVAYEVELAVVIGKCARHVSSADALEVVAGYTLANDVGDRLLEKRTSQWTSGKMFDSFTPLGPWLITKEEIPQPNSLEMTTIVNGQVVQLGNTGDMYFTIPELVSILSNLTTLQPGDLILTGSTKLLAGQANPMIALKPGDNVTIKIDGLGELNNPVQKEPECL